jgi:hypothetical protein
VRSGKRHGMSQVDIDCIVLSSLNPENGCMADSFI